MDLNIQLRSKMCVDSIGMHTYDGVSTHARVTAEAANLATAFLEANILFGANPLAKLSTIICGRGQEKEDLEHEHISGIFSAPTISFVFPRWLISKTIFSDCPTFKGRLFIKTANNNFCVFLAVI